MNKFSYVIVAMLFAGASLAFTAQVHAQSFGPGGVPVLYNQSGAVVNGYNASTNALTPGWYYDESGHQLYYYPDGSYFDPATGMYAGGAYYPSGAGPANMDPASSPAPIGTSASIIPGVPNTGAGGNAFSNWLALALSAMAVALGLAYVAKSSHAPSY